MFLQALQFAITITLESLFNLRYVVFLPIMAVNNSGMSLKIEGMPSLPTMHEQ